MIYPWKFQKFAPNLKTWQGGQRPWGGSFDIANKEARLAELEAQANSSDLWKDSDSAKKLLRERSALQESLNSFKSLSRILDDATTAFDLAKESADQELFREAEREILKLEEDLYQEEFHCKMSGQYDRYDAIVEINGGSGGTEAQDWALMLLRMYLRWAERKGFKVEQLDYREGEEAGIKSATLFIQGEFAYGFLRSEQGVHRLVRISPFDSNARRHTSFASVAVTPDAEEEIEILIEDKDLRIDTYRSSGAGGQHVNKTDSAVRITHLPTGIVVCCQNERSQHKNKAMAMKVLKAKLFEVEQRTQEERMAEIKGERKKIEFGNQIRSYVLHPYKLVKDLRTNYETSATDDVLDGALDGFIEAYLLSDRNK
ncbi:MAG: peptide chain release factor 2 [Deltaproteobacteria bacterium]|nr:peptide chain release factor 2 [Deltaproteobacteria bacterium]